MKINRSETLRYLGYGYNDSPDKKTLDLIIECEDLLYEIVSFKYTYKECSLTFDEDNILYIDDIKIQSKMLTKNLMECKKVLLFACTLGANIDRLLQKYSKLNPSKAVVLQASAASMIEDYIDSIEETLKEKYKKEKLFLRPRFSPGYADLSLNHQKDFFNILNCPKTIGATLMDNLIMAPSKTVTALIGLAPNRRKINEYN